MVLNILTTSQIELRHSNARLLIDGAIDHEKAGRLVHTSLDGVAQMLVLCVHVSPS